MQCLPLFGPCPHPARSPSSPFGKGSKAQKAGTRDGGPAGPAAGIAGGRPFSSRPGSSGSRVYRDFRRKRKAFGDTVQTARLRPESTRCSNSASLTARSTPSLTWRALLGSAPAPVRARSLLSSDNNRWRQSATRRCRKAGSSRARARSSSMTRAGSLMSGSLPRRSLAAGGLPLVTKPGWSRRLDRRDSAGVLRPDLREGRQTMAIAFIFPGQGSQAVGMGKGLAAAFAPARDVFAEVDAALGDKLSAVMWEGPPEQVTLTENAQPALVAVSLAAMRVLEAEAGVDLKRDAAFVAGHSVGEYSALAAAGALTLADAVRLVRIRGRAMQQAVPVGVGAMAALIGVDFDQAAAIAAEAAQGEIVQAANDNGGGQVVVSGHKAAVERAVEIAKAKGVRRAMMLPVSGPFHSALMQPSATVMADALAKVTVKPPSVPLVANVLAKP